MKCTVVTTLLAVFLLAAGARSASATEVGYSRKIGLGFVLGDPTGLSGKYWVGPTNAFDFALGFTNYGAGIGAACYRDANGVEHCQGYFNTSINIDYLWQSNIVRGGAQLDWYIGGGGRVLIFGGSGFNLGIRMPVGVALMLNNPNFLEFFFELAPAFYIYNGLTFEGGLGMRVYF
jgi:hypothetical protein